jgi:hypothetical protein
MEIQTAASPETGKLPSVPMQRCIVKRFLGTYIDAFLLLFREVHGCTTARTTQFLEIRRIGFVTIRQTRIAMAHTFFAMTAIENGIFGWR